MDFLLGVARELRQIAVHRLLRLWRIARLRWFRWRDRPPMDASHAVGIAHALLAGRIEKAIPYRSFGSDRIRIAVLRRSHDGKFDSRVILLEQFGQSYRQCWESELLSGFRGLWVEDIDGDCTKEILFIEEPAGSGAGTKTLNVCSTTEKKLVSLHEFSSWQDSAGPVSPRIEIAPEPEVRLARAIERFAESRGLLRVTVPNFTDAAYSVAAWHADNGQRLEGRVALRLYPGPPTYGSGVIDTVDAGEVVYTSYFKGPIFGYFKDRDQHFVAFSPAWTYDWAQWLGHDGQRIWFPYKEWFLTFGLTAQGGSIERHKSCPDAIRRTSNESLESRSLDESTPSRSRRT